jgi:hypothetical protein
MNMNRALILVVVSCFFLLNSPALAFGDNQETSSSQGQRGFMIENPPPWRVQPNSSFDVDEDYIDEEWEDEGEEE